MSDYNGNPSITDAMIEAAARAYKDVMPYSGSHARIRAALAAAESASWQPIEPAPKRFETLLLWHSEKRWLRFGKFYPGERTWYYSGTNERSQWAQVKGDEPTHWRHLPSPQSASPVSPSAFNRLDGGKGVE